MQVNSSVNDEGPHIANIKKPNLRRAVQGAVATGLIAIVAASVPRGVTAQDDRACRNATLRGDYGFIVSGIRAVGPGATEMFVGTGLQTYDGNGGSPKSTARMVNSLVSFGTARQAARMKSTRTAPALPR